MKNDQWLTVWRENLIRFHSPIPNKYLIRYINRFCWKKRDCILVPLCGKSVDMLWLAKRGYRVVGVEISPIACKSFFNEIGVKPRISVRKNFTKYQYGNIAIYCGDFFKIAASNYPDIKGIYDCKALIALSHASRKKYLKKIMQIMPSGAIFLVSISTSSKVLGPPFSVNSNEVHKLYGCDADIEMLQSVSLTKRLVAKLKMNGYTDITESVYHISY